MYVCEVGCQGGCRKYVCEVGCQGGCRNYACEVGCQVGCMEVCTFSYIFLYLYLLNPIVPGKLNFYI